MENETAVRGSIIKGILFSLGGAVIGVTIWLIVIWIIRGGTGGGVGGGLAAVTGMLIGGGYRLGAKRAGLGYLIAPIFAIISAVVVVHFGAAIILYREGLATSISDGIDVLFDLSATNTTFSNALMTDLMICVVATVVITIFSLRSGNNSKKTTKNNETVINNDEDQ